ncbi:MAG: META domain-containing protein [Bacteroidales bacterium]|nr:META domain-containing protein [Bacteroidales bacterium]
MKSSIPILIFLSLVLFYSCEKIENDCPIQSIINTKWSLSKIIDNETNEITEFPGEIENFEILFKQLGIIELPGLCNYSFGTFTLNDKDSMNIFDVGPGTEKYCLPQLSMDWENLFIINLRESSSYLIDQNQMTITCDGAYNLVFDFVESFGNDLGKLLFCTNSYLINCPFEIEISIDNVKIDTLTAGSIYSEEICHCIDSFSLHIGIILDISEGTYNYYARELKCSAINKVNSWTGDIYVKKDECATVFLDIIQ